MSFLDDINPVKAVKNGLHTLEHAAESGLHCLESAGSSVLHTVEDASSTLLHAALDKPLELGQKAVSAATHLDLNSIEHALGSLVTSPISTIASGVSSVMSCDLSTAVKSVEALAAITNPLGTGSLALTQVAIGQWESADKKVCVQKVDSIEKEKAAIEFKDFWNVYDNQNGATENKSQENKSQENKSQENKSQENKSQENKLQENKPQAERTSQQSTSQALDFSGDIYNKDASATKGAQSHEYANSNGEKVNVSTENGAVNFQSSKDGKVVTQATQTEKNSVLSHNGETANLDRSTNTLSVTSEEMSLLQQPGNREITTKSGLHLVEKGDEIKVYGVDGRFERALTKDSVRIGSAVTMFAAGTDLNAVASQADNSGRITVMTANDGSLLASLPGGTKIEVRQDHTALIKLADGNVVLYKADGKTSIFKDGKFVEQEASELGEVAQASARALQQVRLHLSGGKVQFKGGEINLHDRKMEWNDENDEHSSVELGSPAQGVTVKTKEQTAHGTGAVVTAEGKAEKPMTMNIEKHCIDTDEFHLDSKETRIHHFGGKKDTIIGVNNSVKFDGGDGPVLNPNGSMKLDQQTFVDANGHVSSGGWSASAGTSGKQSGTSVDSSIATTSSNAAAAALSVYSRAASGVVTMSDIGMLNQNLSDISSVLSQLMAQGRGDLMGELQNASAALVEAINFATPKVQAAQTAMDLGITSPFLIKQIEEGRSPVQTGNSVLAA